MASRTVTVKIDLLGSPRFEQLLTALVRRTMIRELRQQHTDWDRWVDDGGALPPPRAHD